MTPAARIATSIELLGEVAVSSRAADSVVEQFFRRRRYAGAKDRAAIVGRIFAALRHHARLGWWLSETGFRTDDARARILAELMLHEGLAAMDAARLFDSSPYGAPELSAAERELARKLEGRGLNAPEMPEAIRAECPAWAYDELRERFGGRLSDELSALCDEAPVDLRVNSLSATRDQVLACLHDNGIAARAAPLSPVGVRLEGRAALRGLAAFRDGWFELQDEGSQLVALLCCARPDQSLVDFCAGAGGKTLALAASMQNRGRIVACDTAAQRLAKGRVRVRRAGAGIVEPRLLAPDGDWLAQNRDQFDTVLVDAPCSGTGRWRRQPDARWLPIDLDELGATQDAILAQAAGLVRPGGRLVYATCSLLPRENQDRIAGFLARDPAFDVVPVDRVWAEAFGGPCPAEGPFLELTPARHGTDGFFVAVLKSRARSD